MAETKAIAVHCCKCGVEVGVEFGQAVVPDCGCEVAIDPKSIVLESVYHRTIDGNALFAARTRMKVSQAVFADRCGHSVQYQSRLEVPGLHEVLKSKADEIESVLKNGKGLR